MPYLIGIDLGTSGVKSIVLTPEGKPLGLATQEYKFDIPQPGRAEQEPQVWYDAALETLRQAIEQANIDGREVAAIGFSGQMHGLVPLDEKGEPVRPAILWADQRSADQAARVWSELGTETLGEWTANPLATGFMLPSWLWLRENEPETAARTAHLMLPKDYLRYRFTGEIAGDVTDASSTGLFDVANRTWSRPLMDRFDIDPALFPPVFESSAVAGRLRYDVAGAVGLPGGTLVITGGGDQAMQAVGNGVIRPGVMSSTIGSGGVLFTTVKEPLYDPKLRMHTYCHAMPETWHLQAATLNGGLALRWLRDRVLDGTRTYNEIAEAAQKIPPGADGLIFLPYLIGERTPHMDPNARGTFHGLRFSHDWRHMARAIMEGVVLALRDGFEVILEIGGSGKSVIASGGGTRHPLWLQLQADILNRPIYRSQTFEAAAVGAALIAGVGAGVYEDVLEACERATRRYLEPVQPDAERAAFYKEHFARFRALYKYVRPAKTE
jgi:xylulokinase